MSEDNKNIAAVTSVTEETKVNRLSSTEVLQAEPITFDKNVTDEQFDKLFPVIDGARFSGATATASSLAPDDNTPFEITLPELITVSHRVQKTTVITEGQKAFSTPLISNKMTVICHQNGVKSIANLFITPENREDVKYLIRNGKGMAITTNWGDKLTRKVNGVDTKIAKLELLPFENKKPPIGAEILEETKQD